uniref:SWIM-type domain-containing protein n=1 Tax=Macrostomum lignano TaxID=282301 RepID=A0A1I8GU03_9PLAT
EVFANLPPQRRLDEQEKEAVTQMIKLGCNKKLIQAHLIKQGKRVILQDLHNLQSRSNQSAQSESSEVEEKETRNENNKEAVLSLLKLLMHAVSEESYTEIYNRFANIASSRLLEYYRKNWHEIRSEWVVGLKCGAFNNNTNNRVESLNQKLKAVVPLNAKFLDFLDHLLSALASLCAERDYRATIMLSKSAVRPFSEDSVEGRYSRLLTPFVTDKVLHELQSQTDVSTLSASTSATDCTCRFFRHFNLPCRHIFNFRSACNLPLFDPGLCCERWTVSYYMQSHRALRASGDGNESLISSITPITSRRSAPLSEREKYCTAFRIAQRLASLAAESSGAEFKERLQLLANLENYWAARKHVILESDNTVQCASDRCMTDSIFLEMLGEACDSAIEQETSYTAATAVSNASGQTKSCTDPPANAASIVSDETKLCTDPPANAASIVSDETKLCTDPPANAASIIPDQTKLCSLNFPTVPTSQTSICTQANPMTSDNYKLALQHCVLPPRAVCRGRPKASKRFSAKKKSEILPKKIRQCSQSDDVKQSDLVPCFDCNAGKFGKFAIRRWDRDSLLDQNASLSVTIVHAFIAVLAMGCNTRRNPIVILFNYEVDIILSGDQLKLTEGLLKKLRTASNSTSVLLGPKLQNEHFSLLIIDLGRRSVTILDPLLGQEDKVTASTSCCTAICSGRFCNRLLCSILTSEMLEAVAYLFANSQLHF